MPFKIAIIGGGPAGCMLGRLLQQASIPFTVFEAEESINFRSQGGSLDLHKKTGQLALKEAGLYEKFLEKARFDGEALVLCDKKLVRYVNFPAPKEKDGKLGGRGAPEIDRSDLRRLLLESLDPESIQWGHKLDFVDIERMELHFKGKTIPVGPWDLIIGADGAWSRVGAALSDQKPEYAGIGGYTLHIPNAKETAPETYRLVNRGSVFAFSDGKDITAQQVTENDTINVSFWSVRREDWMKEPEFDPQAVKDAIKREIQDWDPIFSRMIDEASLEGIVPRSLYTLPVGYTWQTRQGVTLLGDAAHLMPPYAGEGVNLAFEDARLLAKAIIDASTKGSKLENLHKSIASYEKDLLQRAKRAQEMTDKMTKAVMFTEGAPRSSVEAWILAKVAYEFPAYLYPLFAVVVYTYYFWFKLLAR